MIMSDIQKTYSPSASQIEKKWFLIDAEGKVLGRLAVEVSRILRGKHKPTYTPHLDDGDNIVIINAEKIVLTGTKSEDKEYFSHTQYPGGGKFTNIKKVMITKPEFVIRHAVWGMMPKNRLGKKIINNLKIYPGASHPHESQQPEKLEI
jgi:large subunit ribosomal protein L13